MGKMKEVAEQIVELKRCTEILIDISDKLTDMFCVTDEKSVKDEKNIGPITEEKKQLTLEEVRAVLARKSRDGHTGEIKAILSSFGVDRLSAINPTKYEELIQKVEVI